jgi:hypothetical protein
LMSWRRISLLSASTLTSGRSMPSGSAISKTYARLRDKRENFESKFGAQKISLFFRFSSSKFGKHIQIFINIFKFFYWENIL